MKNDILFAGDAKRKLLKGIDILASAVAMSLGPRGRTVAIAKADMKGNVFERKVIDDGVTIAKAIQLQDEFEDMGAALLRQAAQKQVDEVGDGTTATIVLAHEIIKQASRQIEEGVNPMKIRKELEKDTKLLVDELKKMAKPIKTLGDKVKVATISAKDEELGTMIANTFDKVGVEGVITVEESRSTETVVEHQQGMQFDRGYVSPYFVTDPLRMTATMEDTRVLITDHNVVSFVDLIPLLELLVQKTNKIITIIAPEFGGDVLPSLIQNKFEGKLLPLCISAPSFSVNQKFILQDIAILTGATFITKEAGKALKDTKLEDLGYAQRVTSTKEATIIVGGKGTKESIDTRIAEIKEQIKEETVEFDQQKLRERLGKLSDGIAVIKVGGQTEVEMSERKERALDAVSATKAAIEDGIIAGGEVAYLAVRHTVKHNKILYNALKKPFYQLLENSGIDAAEIMFNVSEPKKDMGVDVTDGTIQNMIDVGIIDPVAVPRQAILNAVSVAIQIISSGAVIVPHIKNEVSNL